jgi:hypothetical protein
MTGAIRIAPTAGNVDCDVEVHICLIITIRLSHLLEARCERCGVSCTLTRGMGMESLPPRARSANLTRVGVPEPVAT